MSETCKGCPAFLPKVKNYHIDCCKYNIGSVPRVNCELGEILKQTKELESRLERVKAWVLRMKDNYPHETLTWGEGTPSGRWILDQDLYELEEILK